MNLKKFHIWFVQGSQHSDGLSQSSANYHLNLHQMVNNQHLFNFRELQTTILGSSFKMSTGRTLLRTSQICRNRSISSWFSSSRSQIIHPFSKQKSENFWRETMEREREREKDIKIIRMLSEVVWCCKTFLICDFFSCGFNHLHLNNVHFLHFRRIRRSTS